MPVTTGAARRPVGARSAIYRPSPVALPAPPRRRIVKHQVRNRQRVIAVAVGFVTVISVGLLLTGYGPFFWAHPMQAAFPFPELDGFAKTRVGDVMVPTGQGNTCRRTPYYNDTGLFGADQTVRCDTGTPNAEQESGVRSGGDSNRLIQLRDAFKR